MRDEGQTPSHARPDLRETVNRNPDHTPHPTHLCQRRVDLHRVLALLSLHHHIPNNGAANRRQSGAIANAGGATIDVTTTDVRKQGTPCPRPGRCSATASTRISQSDRSLFGPCTPPDPTVASCAITVRVGGALRDFIAVFVAAHAQADMHRLRQHLTTLCGWRVRHP